ncbi:MAG: RsmB/NOP family class I SAM-dependent RNA methyltransferase [Alphaproteobacteria bacterium]|nr:RsmB/NOP family class I SAM-dependent RNA methyltransferase [Alphaproteobacteria bacterium]
MGLSSESGLPARRAAQSILAAVLRRRRPPDYDAALKNLPPRDAGFARAIVQETLRRFGQLESLIRRYVARMPPPHRSGATFEILLTACCEFLFLGVPAHAAVDAANRTAREDKNGAHFRPLINAVLRRITEEGEGALKSQDAVRLNVPDWLWQRWSSTFGELLAREIAASHLRMPPLDLVLRFPSDDTQAIPQGLRIFDNVLRVFDAGRIANLPGYDGRWWVQDAAASLPVRLLGDVNGKQVMDLCAAPGGKTLQLAARGAEVVAVDRDSTRLSRMRDNLQRIGLEATLVDVDLRDFAPAEPCGLVLLDAPCSATGTIRRHPELPWIKSADDVNACVSGVVELLDRAAALTAPGGILVYSVCSLEPEEGREQIDAFLAARADFARIPISAREVFNLEEAVTPDGDVRTLPCHLADRGGMDGFYIARLKRTL